MISTEKIENDFEKLFSKATIEKVAIIKYLLDDENVLPDNADASIEELLSDEKTIRNLKNRVRELTDNLEVLRVRLEENLQ